MRNKKLSRQQEIVCSLMKCSFCNQFPIIPNYFHSNGRLASKHVTISDMEHSATAECPKCNHSWPIFATEEQSTSSLNDISKVCRFEFSEMEYWEEAFDQDERAIDNGGNKSMTSKVSMSKEWSQTYEVDFEKTTSSQKGVNLNLLKVFDIKGALEHNLRKRYSISENIKKSHTDELSIEIPPKTKVIYSTKWKRKWQKGLVKCLDEFNQEIAQIPFQAAVGMDFDCDLREEPLI